MVIEDVLGGDGGIPFCICYDLHIDSCMDGWKLLSITLASLLVVAVAWFCIAAYYNNKDLQDSEQQLIDYRQAVEARSRLRIERLNDSIVKISIREQSARDSLSMYRERYRQALGRYKVITDTVEVVAVEDCGEALEACEDYAEAAEEAADECGEHVKALQGQLLEYQALDSLYKPVRRQEAVKSDFWKNRFYIGVGGGVGYGIITGKPDVFVGLNFGFRIL